MTTKNICTCEMVCIEEIHRQTVTKRASERTVWKKFEQIAGTIKDYAAEIYHFNQTPKQEFSNGGPRVLIRPDRVDLI